MQIRMMQVRRCDGVFMAPLLIPHAKFVKRSLEPPGARHQIVSAAARRHFFPGP